MADAATPGKGESTFASTKKFLGRLMGGLSIFALVAKTWASGIATPLQLLVETYDAFLNFFLGWAQPYLHAAAETLGAWTGLDLHLYPHWKVSVVAYGILVGAGLSAWANVKFPSAPKLPVAILSSAAGVMVGLIDALQQRDLQPGESFYGLWQAIGQNYLLVLTLAFAAMLALLGLVSRRAKQSFLSARDADLCWTVGERALGIYAGAAAFALAGVGGKLLGL
jgi:hypothetical protein